jgi:hypothetical protein
MYLNVPELFSNAEDVKMSGDEQVRHLSESDANTGSNKKQVRFFGLPSVIVDKIR